MTQNHGVDINPLIPPTENQRASFVLKTQNIAVSDAVFWRNNDSNMHQPKPVGGADDDWTDPIPSHSNSERCPSFSSAGTYNYVCAFHSGESGTIIVT
jgi:plastocyanin